MNTHLPQWLITLTAIIFAVVLALFGIKLYKDISLASENIQSPRSITVTGESEVMAVPDTSTFSFSVIGEASTSEVALTEASKKGNAILNYLEEQGIAEKNIKTTSLRTNPRYVYGENQPPRINGYESEQTVTVKIEDNRDAGEIISGVTERGADRVSEISFTIDDDESLKRQAREQAIKDAQEEALMLAEDLSVSLGEVMSFNESVSSPGSYQRHMLMADGAEDSVGGVAPQLPRGENTYRSVVDVTFRIY